MKFDGTEYNKEHFEPVKPCAWCLKEQGIPPKREGWDSHGICDRHYAEEMAKMDKEERDEDSQIVEKSESTL